MTAGRRAGAGLIVVLLAGAPAVASEHDQDHSGSAASTDISQLDPQTAEVARRLWGDLVCLCGRCERLTLSGCHCPDAAAARKNVLELLRGRDLMSPGGTEAAYQAVRKEYVARFGREVLASEQHAGISGDAAAMAVSVTIVAAACGAVAVIETRRRRGRRSGSRVRR